MFNYERPPAEDAARLDPNLRYSSVLMLLYPEDSEWHTVLMLRPDYPGTHGGQVSFPGGAREPHDSTPVHTALREAHEELSIPQHEVEIVGELSPIYIPPSSFLVNPFVGFLSEKPVFIPEKKEVAEIIETPIRVFEDESNMFEDRIYIPGRNVHINAKAFDVKGYTVWGATAMILSEWREVASLWQR